MFSQSHKLHKKNPSTRHEQLPFKLLVREPKTPTTIWAIAVAFGCFIEVEGKVLPLKIPHTGVGGIMLEVT